ncbi:SAV_915 family protein [Amycolatopsis sp. NPDC049868]|uniref:SAV_915 family protein n=1 Tax=Amycolatopsis sp. NPDC049868 TaxID=3363934 RepID=UPI00379EA9BA
MSDVSWFHAYGAEPAGSGPVTTFEPDWRPAQPPPTGPEAVPVGAPPLLWVPCVRPVVDGDVAVETRVMRDGRIALLAYTALDRLAAYCGATQPCVAVITALLDELDRITPFDVLLLDVPVPYHARAGLGGVR